MRQLAAAGSILLVCLLSINSSAFARNRYTASYESLRVHSTTWTWHGAGRRPRIDAPLSIQPARAGMANIVLAAARRHGVPEALAYGVASVESGFNPHARSRSGAMGLMQILPSTARGLGCSGSMSNPVANADCGARYLASILSDQGGNMRRAAAFYNQGRFARHISRGGARYADLVMAHARRHLPA